MATIIAGMFETQVEADRAIGALKAAGFGGNDITSFYLNPPGQHATYPIGGDAHHDAGAKEAGKTAAAGATVGGVTGLALGTMVGAVAEPGFTALAAVAGYAIAHDVSEREYQIERGGTWDKGKNCATFNHACGTAAMGSGPDAVVDPALAVIGIEGLRIADASIMSFARKRIECESVRSTIGRYASTSAGR